MRHDYILFKRKGKKVWYIYYNEKDIRKSKSTGKTLKFKAEEVTYNFIQKMKNPNKDLTLAEFT
ncbi:MAG: hypothetical protein PQJ58_01370 [Spirochaetales bacterium]|nr:hypothetical protein [Spirochaetales bacterium]